MTSHLTRARPRASVLILALLMALLALAPASGALAQRRGARETVTPGVVLSLTPVAPGDRYRYTMELLATAWRPAEVVADRRLLTFELLDAGAPGRRARRGRRVTCRHPNAPRRVDEGRVREIGGAELSSYREWIDLREYCVGRALEALERGATVTVTYGFARRARGVFVARPKGDAATSVRALAPLELTVAARPEPASTTPTEPGDPPAVRLSLRSADVSSEDRLSLRPTIRSSGRSVRVYLKDDLFRFRVRGPLGENECGLLRQPIVPIIDFFSRLSGRRSAGASILASLACEGAFQVDGAYEVTPMVDLVYDGSRDGLEDVVTGTFTGEPALVRIREGDHGYVERGPTPAPANGDRP